MASGSTAACGPLQQQAAARGVAVLECPVDGGVRARGERLPARGGALRRRRRLAVRLLEEEAGLQLRPDQLRGSG
ncbi:hypothetical protein [Pseudonocardia sp. GCM10023141]|uniref:hypothetical protein n=1 Tax=Pseudonocardia sp. GCM10023141 TaxID=3252653 RepID=UPI00360C9E18